MDEPQLPNVAERRRRKYKTEYQRMVIALRVAVVLLAVAISFIAWKLFN